MELDITTQNKSLVDLVLSTYDLPEGLRKKLSWIAKDRVSELRISGFDDIYRYTAYLVERFQEYRGIFVPIEDSRELLYQIINSSNDLFEARQASLEELTANEILLILQEHLPEHSIGIIRELLSRCDDKPFLLDKRDFFRNINYIQYKLEELVSVYAMSGRLLIPPRPIIHIGFNPVNILFGRRNYKGNPIDFFNSHQDFYGQFSRGQLCRVDGGLYASLRKYNQLSLAIPKFKGRVYSERGGYPSLSNEELKRINDAHAKYDGNSTQASKNLPYDHLTILKYWRKEGLKIYKKGRRGLTEQQIKGVIDAYKTFEGNASQAGRYLHYSDSTIGRYWRKAGLGVKSN